MMVGALNIEDMWGVQGGMGAASSTFCPQPCPAVRLRACSACSVGAQFLFNDQ